MQSDSGKRPAKEQSDLRFSKRHTNVGHHLFAQPLASLNNLSFVSRKRFRFAVSSQFGVMMTITINGRCRPVRRLPSAASYRNGRHNRHRKMVEKCASGVRPAHTHIQKWEKSLRNGSSALGTGGKKAVHSPGTTIRSSATICSHCSSEALFFSSHFI